eukprot:SM000125S26066  [mRNA]  locus=s125:91711:95056:+ [translate_table: standard]
MLAAPHVLVAEERQRELTMRIECAAEVAPPSFTLPGLEASFSCEERRRELAGNINCGNGCSSDFTPPGLGACFLCASFTVPSGEGSGTGVSKSRGSYYKTSTCKSAYCAHIGKKTLPQVRQTYRR